MKSQSLLLGVVGLFLAAWAAYYDGWWHVVIGRESFWIPLHLVLYSGVCWIPLSTNRQMEGESGAVIDDAAGFDGTSVEFQNALRDRKAEAGAVGPLVLFNAVEAVEDIRQLLLRDSATGIGHLNLHPVIIENEGKGNRPAFGRVPQGVLDEILKHPFDQPDVGRNKRKIFAKLCPEPDLFFLRSEPELLHDILNQLAQGEGLDVRLGLVRIQFGQLKKFRDQSSQSLAVFRGDLKIVSMFLRGQRPFF